MRRSGRQQRNYWDEDQYWHGPGEGSGSVHDLSDSEESPGTACVLWVPDPEQRHGWREYYVPNEKPQAKPSTMGFKPNQRAD